MKHKITKQTYHYECGDKCCSEWGTIWTLNGKQVYRGPQDEQAFLEILSKLNIQTEIVDVDSETGEEICSLNNFSDTIKE